jgi:rRNA maturation endonuclease Nob1
MSKCNCACHSQIVWFFDKPTVIVCKECEKTFHYTAQKCDECGGRLTSFVQEEEDFIDAGYDED